MKKESLIPLLILGIFSSLYSRDISENLFNFENNFPKDFSFFDEKGSNITTLVEKTERRTALRIDYEVRENGYAGWGTLISRDLRKFETLSLSYKGPGAWVSLKDGQKNEKRVSLPAKKSWETVIISLSQFRDLDLSHIENLSVSFPPGEGSFLIQEASVHKTAEQSAAVIDNFEKTNPSGVYYQEKSELSDISLQSTPLSKDGEYALAVRYTFEPNLGNET
ncbi:MAG TPA: hypothetical protein VJC03_02370, partial [bacterium]|nr:hypothetical protein [bacterium]